MYGIATYLYRGYNPFTKDHGHPSILVILGTLLVNLLSFQRAISYPSNRF